MITLKSPIKTAGGGVSDETAEWVSDETAQGVSDETEGGV